MATKNMSYDHPAYTGIHALPTGQMNGSGGASTKFVAFTGKLVKSVVVKATTAGTSNDVFSLIQISGTTTTTTALATVGSGATTFQYMPVPGTAQTLSQGDTYYVVKGTDATGTYVGEVEVAVAPLANLTV